MKRFNNILKLIKNKYFIDLNISDKSTILISGMGRSGTTWLSDMINYNNKYRDIFEPFLPYKVETAKYFNYLQYLNPNNGSKEQRESANRILSGKMRSNWTDTRADRFLYFSRIIKDIRTNLMLGWLHSIKPKTPIILIMRSPYSVIDSYKELGWGIEAAGNTSDFERITSQKELFTDYPFIEDIYSKIDHSDYITKLAFQWCVLYYIPLNQLQKNEFFLVKYEDLLLDPENTLEHIFEYLGKKINIQSILKMVEKPSVTNYRKVNFNSDKNHLIEKWKNGLSKVELKIINDIIIKFEMDHLYDKNGYPFH